MTQSDHEDAAVNPRFGRRSWVKLWVNEWLDGTTRFEMSDAQRAFWIDLLALAGRSRFPGVVCAGKTSDGAFVGYPVNKYQSFMSTPMDVEETFALFVRAGKVEITVTQETPIRLLMVRLINWEKYQSEYQRQKKYRDSKDGVTGEVTHEVTKKRSVSESVSASVSASDSSSDPGFELHPVPEGKKKQKQKPSAFVPPTWVPAKSWIGFVEMRKKKHPLTYRAMELIVMELAKLRDQKGQDPGKVLDQSTMRGYRGVFEVKEDGDGGRTSKTEQRTRHNDAAGERFLARHGVPPPDQDRG